MAQVKNDTLIAKPAPAFEFIEMIDTGDGCNACCPHCGADGRYIYVWREHGSLRRAMAGCYKLLTGKVTKSELDKMVEKAHEKQSRGKAINGWEKTVLRMMQYKSENAGDPGKVSWAERKMWEAVSEFGKYKASKFRR